MKCPNCGQEIIDSKEFCVNCGKQLKESKPVMKSRTMIIVIFIMLLTISVPSIVIMNIGLDKEIEPYLNDSDKTVVEEDETIELEDYYGEYIIKNITPLNLEIKDPIDEKSTLGWNMDFKEEMVKIFTGAGFYNIKEPGFTIQEEDKFKDSFVATEDKKLYNVFVEGLDLFLNSNLTINFVIFNSKLYFYDNDYLYALEKVEPLYEDRNNFYKVNLPEKKYTKEINDKISIFETNIKNQIEASNEDTHIFNLSHELLTDGDIEHIFIRETYGYAYSSSSSQCNNITYNIKTLKLYNLEEYLNYKKTDFDSFNELYKKKAAEQHMDLPDELKKNTPFCISNNNIVIKSSEYGPFGPIFVEIEL